MLRPLVSLTVAMLWPTLLLAQPTLRPEAGASQLTIENLTPGAGAAVLAVHRRLDGHVTVGGGVREIVQDDDGDGSVSLALEQPIPLASIWAVVDLGSGEASVAWPAGFEPEPLAADGLRLAESREAEDARLVITGRLLEVFLVRPGDEPAAWHATLANGGPTDAEPDPAVMALPLTALENLEGSTAESAPAPTTLVAGDVLVLFDPTRLRWQLVEAGEVPR